MEILALFLIILAAIPAMACAINYFWRTGGVLALSIAAFVVVVFIVFWTSGLWVGASRHSWGILTPLFVLMIAACAALVGAALWGWRFYRRKKRGKQD